MCSTNAGYLALPPSRWPVSLLKCLGFSPPHKVLVLKLLPRLLVFDVLLGEMVLHDVLLPKDLLLFLMRLMTSSATTGPVCFSLDLIQLFCKSVSCILRAFSRCLHHSKLPGVFHGQVVGVPRSIRGPSLSQQRLVLKVPGGTC